MTTKDHILHSIRKHQPQAVAHPGEFTAGITYADRTAQFQAVLESVGGRVLYARDLAEANNLLAELEVMRDAKRSVSLVKGLGPALPPGITDPHSLEDVDVTIARGQFGVAENGAIWITEDATIPRAILFICQHLVLLLPQEELVDNMHQAYEQLSSAFTENRFGCFISGPSKTADIEQSLVIGAQGPRSLTVVLINRT